MCGIAGKYIFNQNSSVEYQPEILHTLHHRGPDVQKHLAFEKAIFYHTRLSILDLSKHNHQPYTYNNKCLVFNGEIFNYKSIAEKIGYLSPKGDTEVLIRYFEKYKENGLNNLNGFFAFAFYDHSTKELYVVRDRFGEKPLYYYYDRDCFAFASEIYPLLQLIQKKLPLDLEVLYTYFRMHYIPGHKSILKGIYRLPPGHYIHIKNNTFSIQSWYHLDTQKTADVNFETLLHDAVKHRLISDAPIGAFLSGGVDSSIICAIAKQYKNDLHTFSLGYKGEKLYNETTDALRAANHIKSIHHSFEISTDEIISQIPQILNTIDEPFADSSSINVFFLTQKIKPYATVAISGDGADELLMGYNKHKIFFIKHYPLLKILSFLLSPLLSVIPDNRSILLLNHFRKLKKFITASQLPSLSQYIYLAQWAEDVYIHKLFRHSLNNHYFYTLFDKYKNLEETKLFNLADIEIVLSNDMLYKIDFFGMQNAVEIRSPFLDHRVVEYLFTLPLSFKIHKAKQKYLLQKTFSHLLPPSVFSKKKSGFEIPLHKILPSIIPNHFALQRDFIENQKLFNFSEIKQLLKQLPYNANDSALKLWTILVFQSWYHKFEQYIDKTI